MCVVATLSKKTMCVVAALMEWLTWSKSCLPVVLVWMANSSSASMVVTRTLYCKIIHTHLVRIIKLMVYVLHDYNYITWYLISQWKQIQRKLFEVHHFSCEENPTFCLPASIKHFNFFLEILISSDFYVYVHWVCISLQTAVYRQDSVWSNEVKLYIYIFNFNVQQQTPKHKDWVHILKQFLSGGL